MGTLDAIDRAQRRTPLLGVPIAVFYKFYDDLGHYHSATLTYYAFMAIFPLLLLASSILGFVLQGSESLQEWVLESALAQFPIIGQELESQRLQGSTAAVVLGLAIALFGASGLGQAVQNTLNAAWAVPRNSRPNPFFTRGKSMLLLMMAGMAIITVSTASLLLRTEVFGSDRVEGVPGLLLRIATALAVGLILTGLAGFAAADHEHVGHSWPGAFLIAGGWGVLQFAAEVYAQAVLVGPSEVNQTFGLVLGLMAMIYIAATIGVIGIELNVVLARGLWPRSFLTLFVDNVELTEADRRTYAGLAHTNTLKGFQSVAVRFDERSGDTHEIVLDAPRLPDAHQPTEEEQGLPTSVPPPPTEPPPKRPKPTKPPPTEPAPTEPPPTEPPPTMPVQVDQAQSETRGTNR